MVPNTPCSSIKICFSFFSGAGTVAFFPSEALQPARRRRRPRNPKPLERQNFPYRFDSLLQIAVDFESFLEPTDSRISGAQSEMLARPTSLVRVEPCHAVTVLDDGTSISPRLFLSVS